MIIKSEQFIDITTIYYIAGGCSGGVVIIIIIIVVYCCCCKKSEEEKVKEEQLKIELEKQEINKKIVGDIKSAPFKENSGSKLK